MKQVFLSNPVSIRSAEVHDAEALAALVKGLADYEEEVSRFTAADFLRDGMGEQAKARFWVAEMQGALIGFIMGYGGYDLATATAGMHLGDLFVAEAWRGQGIGRQLVRTLSAHALAHGGEWLSWSVLRDNREALAFYQRLGAVHQSEISRMALGLRAMRSL